MGNDVCLHGQTATDVARVDTPHKLVYLIVTPTFLHTRANVHTENTQYISFIIKAVFFLLLATPVIVVTTNYTSWSTDCPVMILMMQLSIFSQYCVLL